MRWIFFGAGVLLLVCAPALRGGDKRAYVVALVAGVVCCVILWQPGAPGVEHVLAILFVTGLVVWRRDFEGSAHRISRRAGPALVVCALAFAGFGFVALREHFVPPLGAAGSLQVALLRLRFLPPPAPNWHSPGASWFLEAFPFVIYVSALAAILMFIQSGKPGKSGISAGCAGRSGRSG
jgi:hypothetical protein